MVNHIHTSRGSDGRKVGGVSLDRPIIMGILNITQDSFSDGGQFFLPQHALEQAYTMLNQGADVIDVGGESTRPGSLPISPQEQIDRVAPVIQGIASMAGQFRQAVAISIDTTSAQVAQAAWQAGATIINDTSAGQNDPCLLDFVAKTGQPIVLMHIQGRPLTMQDSPHYQDVVSEVIEFLLGRVEVAMQAGIAKSQIILDPGIGFGKTREHNLTLLAHLDRLVAHGYPVLLGASRKRFMNGLSSVSWEKSAPQDQTANPQSLVGATCATTAWGVSQGVKLFRVHDVLPNRQVADLAWELSSRR